MMDEVSVSSRLDKALVLIQKEKTVPNLNNYINKDVCQDLAVDHKFILAWVLLMHAITCMTMLKRVKSENVPARGDVISDKEKFALVEIIRSFAPIWNPEDSRYKDLNIKRSCWAGVAEELSLQFSKQYSIVDLQKTYRNMRDTYVRKRRDIQKLHTRKSGAAAGEYQSAVTWPYYKAMSYLESTFDLGKRYTNVQLVNAEDVGEDLIVDDVGFQDEVVIEADDVLLEEPVGQRVVNGKDSYRYAAIPRGQRAEVEKGRKRKSVTDDFKDVLKSFGEHDAYDAIGAHMACRLRELHDLDPILCEEWVIKVEELQCSLSREILEFKRNNVH
ncbi:hypothetical protein ANCCAN_01733 [Ancylostoma caninum]|uniref:MADF domain-containing protein n=1 Tax=Ancylostoma caninum TaxID=29170 RepID=A0A368HAB3_ANCCA|nr:hypothetical protein ANCCAN_01733 [Ancylostoma caninum]